MKYFLQAMAVPVLASVSLVAAAQSVAGPEIAAKSYMVLDVTANQVLLEKDVDMQVEPASLTKLMTAYLVFDALRSKKSAWRKPCPSVSRPGRCPARACSSTPRCRCRWKT